MICYNCRSDKPHVEFIVCEEAGKSRVSRLCESCRAVKTAQAKVVPPYITCSTCREEKPKKEFRVDGVKERYVSVCQQCKDENTGTQRYQKRLAAAGQDRSRLQQLLSCKWTPGEIIHAKESSSESETEKNGEQCADRRGALQEQTDTALGCDASVDDA